MRFPKLIAWQPRSLRLDRAGVAAIELALALPMLVLLMMGSFDFGLALYEQHRMSAAARAGIQYASATANWTDSADIIAQARADAGDTNNSLTVTTGQCTCPTGSTLCSSSTVCTGSTVAGTYVKVTVSESYSTLMSYPFMSNPVTLAGQAVMRMQ
jgi:Flp pilus assembly protein TadG